MTTTQRIAYLREICGGKPGSVAENVIALCDDAEADITMLTQVGVAVEKINELFEGVQLDHD
jgi:hypothetical protein